MSQKLLLSAGLLFLSCSLFSEEQIDSVTKPSQLPTVYSEITPAHATFPEFSSAAVSVISKEQFHANDVTVADVLELTPGIQLQSTGETGAYSSLSIRGAPSQQTQVFVDGVLQSNAGGQGTTLQNIPLIDIERIEVYKSSSPGQLAMGSPGGAINIVRKRATQNTASILLEAGSYEHFRIAGSIDRRMGNNAVNSYFALQTSKNNFEYNNDNGTPQYLLDDKIDNRNNAEFTSAALGVTGTRLTSSGNVGLGIHYYEDIKHLPDSHNTETNNAQYSQQKISALASLNVNQWIPDVDTSIRFNIGKDTGFFENGHNTGSYNFKSNEDNLYATQLNHSSIIIAPIGLITSSNIISFDQFILDDSVKGETLDATRIMFANSLGAEVFYSDRITLMSNVRATSVADMNQSNSDKDTSLGGNLGLRFGNKNHFVILNGQYAHRIPNLIERYGNQGVFVGNSDLQNETAVSVDVTLTTQAKLFQFEASAYARHSKNGIAPVYNAQGIGRYINLDSVNFIGGEWRLSTAIRNMTLETQGSLSHSIASSFLRAYDQKRVPGFYPVTIKNKATLKLSEQWKAQADYQYEYGLYYDRANSTLAPNKHQFNAELQWQKENSILTFRIENMLDRAHLDFSRKPLPGRTFTLTYVYKFGE